MNNHQTMLAVVRIADFVAKNSATLEDQLDLLIRTMAFVAVGAGSPMSAIVVNLGIAMDDAARLIAKGVVTAEEQAPPAWKS